MWIGSCLYWPFYARELDLKSVSMEVQETYKVCLQQPGVSKQDCLNDRAANKKFQGNWIAPPGKNVYQTFAGGSPLAMMVAIAVLCVIPPVLLYPLVRGIAAIFAWMIGRRIATISAAHPGSELEESKRNVILELLRSAR